MTVISKRIWQLVTLLPAYISDDYQLIIDYYNFPEAKKMSIGSLKEYLKTEEKVEKTDVITSLGLGSDLGFNTTTFDTTNFMTTDDFTLAGYDQNHANAMRLLDNNLYAAINNNNLVKVVTLAASDILNINTTPKILIDSAGAGKFINLIRLIGKNTFNVNPYDVGAPNDLEIWFSGGSAKIASFTRAFLMLSQTEIQNGELDTNVRLYTNDDIVVKTPNANPTVGDGRIDIIVVYEVLDDFAITEASTTNSCCVLGVAGTFDNASLVSGKLTIHHNKNTQNVELIIFNNSKEKEVFSFTLGDALGANTYDYVTTEDLGTITGTWSYFIIAKNEG